VIDALATLERAKRLLERLLPDMLAGTLLEAQYPRLVATFRDGIMMYVRYNEHGQYSYSIIFSGSELDRCRFDNFDDTWNVASKPNHFHPRTDKSAFNSPMQGDPEADLPVLSQAIKSGILYSKNCRF